MSELINVLFSYLDYPYFINFKTYFSHFSVSETIDDNSESLLARDHCNGIGIVCACTNMVQLSIKSCISVIYVKVNCCLYRNAATWCFV